MSTTSRPAYFPKTRVDKALRRVQGVVEAAHYDDQGQLRWVRVHLRRFDAFADHRILTRDELVARLKAGQTFVLGKRHPFLGNTFELGPTLRLAEKHGQPFLLVEGHTTEERELAGVPLL